MYMDDMADYWHDITKARTLDSRYMPLMREALLEHQERISSDITKDTIDNVVNDKDNVAALDETLNDPVEAA